MEYGYMLRKNGESVEPFCEGKIYSDLYGDTGYPSLRELLDVVETGDIVTLPSIYALGHKPVTGLPELADTEGKGRGCARPGFSFCC